MRQIWRRGLLALRSKKHRLAPAESMLSWLRRQENSSGGIKVHDHHQDSYPEVSGYLVPTLLREGERQLALRLGRWLCAIQRDDGCFTDPKGTPYIFDTGQVLRGLLALADDLPEALDAARRAADYLLTEMVDGGRGGFGERYDERIPESIQLYLLPPLYAAAAALERPDYRRAAAHCLSFYRRHPEVLRLESLTHFLAYELEALIDLAAAEDAAPVLAMLATHQRRDGAVPARRGSEWVCIPGLAQIAICWYRLGQHEAAERAFAWLDAHQRRDGSLRGSIGPGSDYFPHRSLPWAAKFYLDGHRLRLEHALAHRLAVKPPHAEVLTHLSRLAPVNGQVAEIGCRGSGYMEILDEPCQVSALALSDVVREALPATVDARRGGLERLPWDDASQDLVFAVDALGCATNPPAAVAECVRLARPGGSLLIAQLPASATPPPWASRPTVTEVHRWLQSGGVDVVRHRLAPDGWWLEGTKVEDGS